jgi:hypothetical protein
MAVRKKIMLVMSLLAFVCVAGLAIVRYTQRRTIDTMCGAQISRFDAAVDAQAAPVKTFVTDYTYWDDLVRFLKTGNTQWAAANLTPCLKEYKVNGIWVYRPDAKLVFSAGVPPVSLPREACDRLFAHDRFCHFFITTPQGLMEIRGATIHPTNDPGRTTTPSGFLLAGTLWTDSYVRRFGTVSLASPSQARRTIDPATDLVTVARRLDGWDGKPVMVARLTSDTPLIGSVARIQNREFYTIGLTVLLVFILFAFLLKRWITRPLELIYGALDSEDTTRIAALTAKGGEFGYIAQLIVRAFEQKSQLVKDMVTLRSDLEAAARENDVLTLKAQTATNELVSLTEKYNTLMNGGGSGVPGAYAELEKKFQDLRTRLHVLNELLQREMTKSHEHHQAEMLAAYEREQALKELNRINADLERRKMGAAADVPVIAIDPAITGTALVQAAEPVLAGSIKRPKGRRKCLGANLPKIKYTAASSAQTSPVHGIPTLQN